MGQAVSITKNAPELISKVMNEISTEVFMKNSVEDTNTNSFRASCDASVIENINSICLESISAKQKAAKDTLIELLKLNVKMSDASVMANKILDMDNPACNTDLCVFKNINQKITRSITVNDSTATNMAAAMKSSLDNKVDQIIKPEIEAGLADATAINDLGTKIKTEVGNLITSKSVIETLRKFSNTNSIDAKNTGMANFSQEIAGTAYASSITNSIMNNNSELIANIQATMDLSPKLKTASFNFGLFAGIVGFVVVIVLIIVVVAGLKSQKNTMQFAKDNPEMMKMMMGAPAGPAGMAAMAAMPTGR